CARILWRSLHRRADAGAAPRLDPDLTGSFPWRAITHVAQLLAVWRRGKRRDTRTSRPRQGAPLCRRWARRRYGETPWLSQVFCAAPSKRWSESAMIISHGPYVPRRETLHVAVHVDVRHGPSFLEERHEAIHRCTYHTRTWGALGHPLFREAVVLPYACQKSVRQSPRSVATRRLRAAATRPPAHPNGLWLRVSP